MFGPLCFKTTESKETALIYNDIIEEVTECVLCETVFTLPAEKSTLLDHLKENHKLIISDVHKIASLSKYISYWKERMKTRDIESICLQSLDAEKRNECSTENTCCDSSEQREKSDDYFLLSEKVDEDRELRERLQANRLEFVLEKQRQERELHNYCRECWFCHTLVKGTIADYLSHLAGKHNLHLGKPQNLVFVHEFIDAIEKKMENLVCIYCEKVFKDRAVLKEHMRKKLHKRINPKNTEYDKFYMVNYLEMGRNWKTLEKLTTKEVSDSESEDSDWSDWIEDTHQFIICLLCKRNFFTFQDTLDHMKSKHVFDFKECAKDLTFYQQVKLVNYIRRQVHRLQCIGCDRLVENDDELLQHMASDQHLTLPTQSLWDQPEYFFPTYENDLFLCQIEDPQDESETSSGVDVHCESEALP